MSKKNTNELTYDILFDDKMVDIMSHRIIEVMDSMKANHPDTLGKLKEEVLCDIAMWSLLFEFVKFCRDDGNIETKKVWKKLYNDYLSSYSWNIKRDILIKKYDGRCQLCNSNKNINIHHRTYENLGDEKFTDLTVLCNSCHKKFHDIG